MQKRRLFIVALILLPAAIFAQEVVVEYLDGYLDVESGGSWAPLYIGDTLASNEIIRLDEGAYAELSRGTVTVRLRRAGEYAISSLFEQAGRVERAGIGAMIASRVSALSTEREDDTTSVGGVRASEAATAPEVAWAGGESVNELIDEGIGLLDEGALEDAYWTFAEAYDYALSDAEFERSAFFFGYAAMQIGEYNEALGLLEEAGPNPDTEFFAQHSLALAQLLISEFAYVDAISVLEDLETQNPHPEEAMTAWLLRGIAHAGLGDSQTATTYLQRVVEEGDGATAEAASSILAEL